MSDFKFNLCRSKRPKYYYWLESLEIARRRFRKFNSKYIESIKICAPDISAARYKLQIYKITYKLSTSLLDNITVKRRDHFYEFLIYFFQKTQTNRHDWTK